MLMMVDTIIITPIDIFVWYFLIGMYGRQIDISIMKETDGYIETVTTTIITIIEEMNLGVIIEDNNPQFIEEQRKIIYTFNVMLEHLQITITKV